MHKLIKFQLGFNNTDIDSVSSGPVIVGYNQSGAFSGFIDNVAFFSNGVPSYENKRTIWENREATEEAGLFSNFHFDEGTDVVVTDSIGGLTGTITSGEWQ